MNYTNYILHGQPLRPESFISDKPVVRQVTVIAVLPATLVGAVVLVALYPAAVAIDMGRLIKLRYYQWQRECRRRRYINDVLISLGHANETKWMTILNAAV